MRHYSFSLRAYPTNSVILHASDWTIVFPLVVPSIGLLFCEVEIHISTQNISDSARPCTRLFVILQTLSITTLQKVIFTNNLSLQTSLVFVDF